MNVELKSSLKRLLWLGGLLLLAGLAVSAVQYRRSSHIRELEATIEPLADGSLMLTPADIREAIDRGFGFSMEGLPLRDVDVARLEKVLEKDPLILDADVFVDARNTLRVEVEQRPPLLRVQDRNGLNYYLDGQGLKMPLSKHTSVRVLAANGYIPPYVPDFLERKRHRIKDVFLLAKDISADPFLLAMIEQIYVNNKGEFVLAPMLGDHVILFGYYKDAEEKLRKLKIFYKEVLPYEGWRKYDTIDLRFRGQVIGR
jgi:cell division protein FtsQ